MDVHLLPLSKQKLAALSPHERYIVLLFGQVLNEINIIRKFGLICTLSISDRPHFKTAEAAQALFFMKLLAAKTFEAWEAYRRHFVENKEMAAKFGERISQEAGAVRKELGKQFGGGNVLAKVRNDHVFHFPSPDALEAAFDLMSDRENWAFYLAQTNGNSFYAGADMVSNYAVLGEMNKASVKEAIEHLGEEVTRASGLVVDLVSTTLGVLIETAWPDLRPGKPVIEGRDLPDVNDLWAPFFVSMKSPVEGS